MTVADPAPEQLERLLELQVTDHRVRKLEHQLDDLPEQQQLAELHTSLEQIDAELDEVLLELERAGSRQRQLEREIEVLSERRTAEQTRLYDGSVANARELKAVEAELESTTRLISEHEDLLLEVLETLEELEARRVELDGRGATGRERSAELTAALDASAQGLLAELGELRAAREAQATALPPDLLDRYEAAARRGGGTGVGTLEDNACTACRIALSMADVGELFAGPPLTTCPQCRRLLVVPA